MAKKKKIKTHPCSALESKSHRRAGSEHRGAGGDLTPWGYVGKGLAAALVAQMFSAPPSGCETGNQPLIDLGAVQGSCGRGDEDVNEGCGPAQGGDSPAGFGWIGVLWAQLWDVVSTHHRSSGSWDKQPVVFNSQPMWWIKPTD